MKSFLMYVLLCVLWIQALAYGQTPLEYVDGKIASIPQKVAALQQEIADLQQELLTLQVVREALLSGGTDPPLPHEPGVFFDQSNGRVTIYGTNERDSVQTFKQNENLHIYLESRDIDGVTVLKQVKNFTLANVTSIYFYGYGGADVLYNTATSIPLWAWGGDGCDSLYGGDGVDHIYGENGQDAIKGNGGDDYLNGGPDLDIIYGGPGDDTLIAGDDGTNYLYQ